MSTSAPATASSRGRGPSAARRALLPIAESQAMRDVLAAAGDVALSSTTVLLLGESGTGKEILARHIHRSSPRAQGPWVAVNCAALPMELLESELFGHERGAFTGATERRRGRIEQADHGTLLLDEISELPLPLQAKLLRVLQEREVDRIGGGHPIPVDVRIIATSNRSLRDMAACGEFRSDLFYRLDVFPIELPPLRERLDDIPALAHELVAVVSASLGRDAPVLSEAALGALGSYEFPGNVRELANILERALVRCREPVLDLRHVELAFSGDAPARASSPVALGAAGSSAGPVVARALDAVSFPSDLPLELACLERLAIEEALRREGGNRTRAAVRLGISIRTLRNKLHLYRASAQAQVAPRVSSFAKADASPLAPTRRLIGAPANDAGRQLLPGSILPAELGVRSPTVARRSQRTSSARGT